MELHYQSLDINVNLTDLEVESITVLPYLFSNSLICFFLQPLYLLIYLNLFYVHYPFKFLSPQNIYTPTVTLELDIIWYAKAINRQVRINSYLTPSYYNLSLPYILVYMHVYQSQMSQEHITFIGFFFKLHFCILLFSKNLYFVF